MVEFQGAAKQLRRMNSIRLLIMTTEYRRDIFQAIADQGIGDGQFDNIVRRDEQEEECDA